MCSSGLLLLDVGQNLLGHLFFPFANYLLSARNEYVSTIDDCER